MRVSIAAGYRWSATIATIVLLQSIHCALDLTIPKNFTRSRFSARYRTNSIGNDNRLEPSPTTTTTTSFVDPTEDTFVLDGSDVPSLGTNTTLSCGIRSGGNHPWIAVLEHTDPTGRSRKRTLSKGVLIDGRHVLTTVSSVHNSHPFWTISAVRLGDMPAWANDHDFNRSAIVHARVSSIFQHRTKDIAIVRLSSVVTVEPICLPPSNSYNYRELQLHRCVRPTNGAELSDEEGHRPRVSSVDVQLLQPGDCGAWTSRKGAEISDDEFCAWDELLDTCTGDLGGPLVGGWNGRHYVIGLSSYLNVNDDAFVPSDYPGVYTRVGSHLEWIRAVLKQL